MATFLQNKGFLCYAQGLVVELIQISANVIEPELETHWVNIKGSCDILQDSLAQPGDLRVGCSSRAPGACRTELATHKPTDSCWLPHIVSQSHFHPKALVCGAPKASRCFFLSQRSNIDRCPKWLVLLSGQCASWRWPKNDLLSGLGGNHFMC